MKEAVKDAETGKVKDKPKGLGHWRCSLCGKVAKVRPQAPTAKVMDIAKMALLIATEVPVAVATV
jgi:hypothetical protein